MVSCTRISSAEEIRRIKDYFILDVETTGHDPEQDRVLALGMVRVSDDQVVNEASTFVNPARPIPPEVTELTGIGEDDVANAPGYPQIAGSLAKLLPGSVVTSYDAGFSLEFVTAMLNENGYSGEIYYVDLGRFVRATRPDLAGQELSALAADFGLELDGEPRVLADSLTCYYLLQECKTRPKKPKAQRATPAFLRKAADGVSQAAEGTMSKLSEIGASSDGKAAKRPLTLSEKIQFGLAALCLLLALLFIPSFTSLFFFLAAVVLCPIPFLRDRLAQWKLEGRAVAVVAALLCIAALLCRLPSPRAAKQPVQNDTTPSLIILSWDKPGDYGKEVTLNEDTATPTHFIEFHVPAGSYRVLNNAATTAQVTVYQEGYRTNADGLLEQIPVEDVPVIHVLAGNNKEVLVDHGQYITLSEGAENVIFQYLAEIPEATPDLASLTSEPMQEEVKAWVNGTEVRFRSTPNVNGFIMNSYDTGKEVVVTGTSGEWTAVIVDDQKGYIFSRYLSDTPPGGATPEPSEEPVVETESEGEAIGDPVAPTEADGPSAP